MLVVSGRRLLNHPLKITTILPQLYLEVKPQQNSIKLLLTQNSNYPGIKLTCFKLMKDLYVAPILITTI